MIIVVMRQLKVNQSVNCANKCATPVSPSEHSNPIDILWRYMYILNTTEMGLCKPMKVG